MILEGILRAYHHCRGVQTDMFYNHPFKPSPFSSSEVKIIVALFFTIATFFLKREIHKTGAIGKIENENIKSRLIMTTVMLMTH